MSCSVFSQQKEHQLVVKVTGKFSSEGYLRVNLYNSAKDFLKKPYKILKIPANSDGKVIFYKIPSGKYAILAVNDENKNDKLDKNWIGMPKEAMGCSNGAKGGMFGPPKFKDAQFDIQKDTTITVKIKKIF